MAESYDKIFSLEDEYNTDKSKRRIPYSPGFTFYRRLVWIVIYCNRFARKGIYNGVRWANSSLDIVRSAEKAGILFNVTGLKNIAAVKSPVVFISNHMSTLETLVLPSFIQPVKPVVFVMKEELTRFPLFGTISKARYPIIVGRENPREDLMIVLNEGSNRLSNGRSVIIFPQRTRTLEFDAASFNSLGVKLAKRNNVPVIPIALLTDAWANGKYIKEFGRVDPSKTVHIKFGEPIEIKSLNGGEEHKMVIDFIQKSLVEWGRADLINM